MMYISAFPVIITMRNSNIYEERSLGIFATTEKDHADWNEPSRVINSGKLRRLFISQQIRGQLAHDIWWLALATFVITVIEASHFTRDPVAYSVFNIIFEVISAYGCVGISVGLPGANYSFSGGWHTGSKLVLCLVMLRGRHRILPATMDYAVRLAPKHMQEEAEVG
jgi:Trk-type K+ transport system membrane component